RYPGWPPIGAAIGAPGEHVYGVLLRDVDSDSLALLDCFEDTRDGLYTRGRRTVIVTNGECAHAEVYLCGDRVRNHLAGTWDADAFAAAYYEHYRDVVIPEFLREYYEEDE
ncbi:MAG: gamma-glutamylcyclotransferase, partial [Gammaproteobacteria bacterium]|nr:gamma-glutamylcyclotransferase [Gammaproteobacteria bacterium]